MLKKNHFPKYATALIIFSLLLSCSKTKLTTTNNVGTGIIDSNTRVFLPNNGYLSPNYYAFSAICLDKNNNKWLIGSDGIYEFDGTSWSMFISSNTPGLVNFYPRRILCGNDGTLYFVGGYSVNGVDMTPTMVVYKNGTWTPYTLPFVPDVFQIDGSTGSLYFLSRYAGLTPINRIYKYDNVGSFSDTANYSSIEFGVYNAKDFNVFNDTLFVSINQAEFGYSVDSNQFAILVQSPNGNRVINNYPDSTLSVEFHTIARGNGEDIIMCGLAHWWDPLNGHTQPDLFNFDGGTWTTIPIPSSISITPGFGVKYSTDGTLWIASGSGLTKYINQTFTSYTINIPYGGSVSDFVIDDNNVKWIASWNSGLIAYKVQ